MPILAKSEPRQTLQKHIEDCLQICRQLQECVPNLPIDNKKAFWSLIRKSLIFHDLGKSHREFQKKLRQEANQWYHQRHELFSLYYVANAILPNNNERQLVTYIVAGHHKPLKELSEFVQRNYAEDDWDDDGLDYKKECARMPIKQVQEEIRVYGIMIPNNDVPNIQKLVRRLYRLNNTLLTCDNIEPTLLVGAMKQCDHLASAGFEKISRLEDHDFKRLCGLSLYTHQKQDSETENNVILNAPTGSGKTEAAMLWLQHQLYCNGQGRTFYILPYTASINAMYDRLQSFFGKQKVGILHGRLSEFIEVNMSDESYDMSAIKHQVDYFKSMIAPLKVVTPFQLLKTLFGLKGFEKNILEWSGAYFIFDEIHAYDATTFAQIIVLLKFATKRLGVKVHIMTATLPSFMRKELEAVISPCTNITASDHLYKDFTRHRVIVDNGKLSDHLENIQQKIDEGKHILVVCNTVDQAQSVYNLLHAKHKLLLHSRFNAEDRYEKEKQLSSSNVDLLVGTQAIEISLDIDFDELYSEPAPIDALLQRFGRINRRRTKGICLCHIFMERNNTDKFIYPDDGVISRTLEIFERICTQQEGIVNEKEINNAIDFVYPDWSEQAKSKYDETKVLLDDFVLHKLKPLAYDQQNEAEFYKQFDGCKVLPACFTQTFQERLDEYKLVKANSLLVPISKGRLIMHLKNGEIEQRTFAYCEGTKEKKEYVINKKYSSECGLDFKQPYDKSSLEDIFL